MVDLGAGLGRQGQGREKRVSFWRHSWNKGGGCCCGMSMGRSWDILESLNTCLPTHSGRMLLLVAWENKYKREGKEIPQASLELNWLMLSLVTRISN